MRRWIAAAAAAAAAALVVGCGGGSVVAPVEKTDGPVWYEVVWSESDTGERYMNLCERFGMADERCVELDELPDGCEVSVDWHGEVRCEKEVF